MSDQRDDKLNQPGGQKEQPSYSVEEILSEFSSARKKDRVVPFPPTPQPSEQPERTVRTRRPSPPAPEEEQPDIPEEKPEAEPGEDRTAEIIDLPAENLLFELREKIHGLFRRADAYADQMYQQAEPSPEDLEAEQYIPGVDEEEFPERPAPTFRLPRLPRLRRRPSPPPRDVPPADLAARYKRGLAAARFRLWLCLLAGAAAGYAALPFPLPDLGLEEYALRLLISVIALTAACLLCADVIWAGLRDLFTLRPGGETLAALAALVTLADGLTMPTLGTRGDTLPCAAPACFVLFFALWGRTLKRRADRMACRTAAQAREPYLLTLDESKWSGRAAYCKWSGPIQGFGSQIQSPDGAQRLLRVAVPLLLLACLLCALMASVGREMGGQFLWALSCPLTAAASFSALLIYGLPYHRLSLRLGKLGSALAGWPGVSCCGGESSLVLTDTDLFPTGAVKLNGIKIFGEHSNEKVVAYAATLIRASRCGLERPFSDLMKSQNALYRPVSGVRFHEGGVTGIIRNQEVIVGTAAFLHLMNIAMPQGLHVKNAVFCAIDGELAGIFALHYAMHGDVAPCLTALMRNRIAPLLATRDPNLLPSLLGQKFKLPVDKMEFPAVDRRLELSDPDQEHSQVLTAVLLREGLGPYSDAAVGARRLRTAVRLGGALWTVGAVLGVILTFYLTFVDAYRSLSPAALFFFLLAWLVPTLLLSAWVPRS